MSKTENNPELLKILTNKRSLKAFLKSVPIKIVKDIGTKVLEVTTELEESHNREILELERRNRELDDVLNSLISKGFSPSEITSRLTK